MWRNYVGTITLSNPAAHSVTRHVRTETTSSTKTAIYHQNAVKKAKMYDACRSGRVVRSYNPSAYVHRSLKVHSTCYAGRCTVNSRIYGAWLSGTAQPM